MVAIGAKEGVINATQEKIGNAITNSVLETSDGNESKTINQIELHVLPKTVLDAAEQPAASDARDEFKAFIVTCFNFHGKLVNTVKQVQVKANKVKG